MTAREKYLHLRLMELAITAESRELDEVERNEEKLLAEELKLILEDGDAE